MIVRRIVQLVALLMIGDGVAGFFKPRWHSLLWDVGPAPYKKVMRKFAREPETARWIYLAEVAVGAMIASQQTPEE